MPFADVATPDLPLSRLWRLSLFQVSVGMVQTLFFGTLNRVIILELGVPATIVSIGIAIPLLIAPFRALIGFRSDTYRCVLGWRRVPFIWFGSLMQFGGLAIMPFALLTLSPDAATHMRWVGYAGSALAFFLVGPMIECLPFDVQQSPVPSVDAVFHLPAVHCWHRLHCRYQKQCDRNNCLE